MTGCCTGAVVRLREMNPCAIGVHCAAHRLNLASSQAAEKVQCEEISKHFASTI